MSRIDLRQFLNLEKVKFWSKDCTYWVTAWDSISNIFLQPYNGWMQRQNSWRQRQKGWERQTRKNWMMALSNDWVFDWTFKLSNGPALLNPFLRLTLFLSFSHLNNFVFCATLRWAWWPSFLSGPDYENLWRLRPLTHLLRWDREFMREGYKVCSILTKAD